MLKHRIFVYFFIVALVYEATCSPVTDNVEGRGVGSTIWGWITYPFSWWGSSPTESPPTNEQLVGSVSSHDIEIGKHNVTVWCNDQTCTTMRCDKYGCANITCNIYDTDLNGECRKYNTSMTDEKPTLAPEAERPNAIDETTKAPITTEASVDDNDQNDDRPIELEVLMSSTVTENTNKI